MKRKTSTVPSYVYKYELLPPTGEADYVEWSFVNARIHYNKLITIELVRRRKFREARTALFPSLAAHEVRERELVAALEVARTNINAAKAVTRSRVVGAVEKVEVAHIKEELASLRKTIRRERDECYSPRVLAMRAEIAALGAEAKKACVRPDAARMKVLRAELKKAMGVTPLGRVGDRLNAEAKVAIAALRPLTYWGTYLLVEAQVRDAKSSSSDPDYNTVPPHCLSNRIGVHMCGGMGVDKLASSTLMRISPMPVFKSRASGKLKARGVAARTTLSFRIGTIEDSSRSGSPTKRRGKPRFATFPMIMDRPLPADCRIKDAYIVRQPYSARVPWRYHLCVVLESREVCRTVPSFHQEGTTSINFGWRLIGGKLRVAMVQNDVRGVEEVRLPARILSGFAKCRELQGLLDEKFDAVKVTLSAWIEENRSRLPEVFLDEFRDLPRWKSQYRLADLVWYWRDHRLDGDSEIFPVVTEWKDRYRHLADWMVNERRYLMDWRQNFYREQAVRLATTSGKIVVDTFCIAAVARRNNPEEEETGGQAACTNRVIAAPSILRREILIAAAKYHCLVEAAPTHNGTRRCNVCGELTTDDVVAHIDCVCPKGHEWDQDLNNTDNLDACSASGEVVTLVRPAEVADNGAFVSPQIETFGGARKALVDL